MKIKNLSLQRKEKKDPISIRECFERMKNKNERTLIISFPKRFCSLENIRKYILKASIIKHYLAQDSSKDSFEVEFYSKKRAAMQLDDLQKKEYSFGKLSITVPDKVKEVNGISLQKLRLVVSGIPLSSSQEEVENIFPSAVSVDVTKYASEIHAVFNFATEEDAQEAFRNGKNLKLNNSKLLVIFCGYKHMPGCENIYKSPATMELHINRLNEEFSSTLNVTFPELLQSLNEVEKIFPTCSVIKTSVRVLKNADKISFAYIKFKSPGKANKIYKMLTTKPEFQNYKVEKMSEIKESRSQFLNPLRLILQDIPCQTTDDEVKATLEKFDFKYKSFARTKDVRSLQSCSCCDTVTLTYGEVSEALTDFEIGKSVKIGEKDKKLLIIFDPCNEPEWIPIKEGTQPREKSVFDPSTVSKKIIKEKNNNRWQEINSRCRQFNFPNALLHSLEEFLNLLPSSAVVKIPKIYLRNGMHIRSVVVLFKCYEDALEMDKKFLVSQTVKKGTENVFVKCIPANVLPIAHLALDHLRLSVNNIPCGTSDKDLSDAFMAAGLQYRDFRRSTEIAHNVSCNCCLNNSAVLIYDNEWTALADFEKGGCIPVGKDGKSVFTVYEKKNTTKVKTEKLLTGIERLFMDRMNERAATTLRVHFLKLLQKKGVNKFIAQLPTPAVLEDFNKIENSRLFCDAYLKFKTPEEMNAVQILYPSKLENVVIENVNRYMKLPFLPDPSKLIVKHIRKERSSTELDEFLKKEGFLYESLTRNCNQLQNSYWSATLSYKEDSQAKEDFLKGEHLQIREKDPELLIQFPMKSMNLKRKLQQLVGDETDTDAALEKKRKKFIKKNKTAHTKSGQKLN